MGYEQMELDVTLSGERELKDNVSLAVEFACHQVAEQSRKTVESNHEGYGIAAECKTALDSAAKKVSDDMKLFLRILPAGSSEAISAASSLKNSAIDVAFEAVKLAANADRVMNDLYKVAQSESTPIEEYMEDQDEEFEEAEEQDPEEAEEMQEENEDE